MSGLTGITRAQDLSRTWIGEALDNSFGSAIAIVDDLDGDGAREILVGAPTASETADQSGSAYLYSGADGSLLREWHGATLDELFGTSVCAADDRDGDGVPDLLIGAPSYGGSAVTGSACLYSGATGALIQQLDGADAGSSFGFDACRVADVDADGVRDLAISAWSASDVFVYSGATGAFLRELQSSQPNSGLGCTMAPIGDLDGDGVGELLLGSPFWRDGAGVTRGRAEVWSLAQGTLLQSHEGENRSPFLNDFFGWNVASPGDVDVDGLDDLAVGAWGFGGGQEGRIYLYSGGSGALLATRDGALPGDHAGWALSRVGDVDGDGVDDLGWGGPHRGGHREGGVTLCSGRSGAQLAEITSTWGAVGDQLGVALAGGADVDGDGGLDLLVGAVGPSTGWSGSARLFALRAPRIDTMSPPRGFYRDDTSVTIVGGSFHAESGLQAWIGGALATDTVVVDESTVTCTVAAGAPAILDVELRCNLGVARTTFLRTPSLTAGGDLSPGGQLDISAYVNAHDALVLIAGLPPIVSIATPPFDGTLAIDPFITLLIFVDVPSDRLDLAVALPDDASLSGLTVLLQELAGAKLAGRKKDGAWSNCASVTFE